MAAVEAPPPLTQKMLEAVLDQLPIGAIVLDDEAVVQRFNRYEEQLSGRSRQEVIGRTFFSEIAPCTRDIELGHRFREGIERQELDLDVEFAFPYPYNRVAREVRIRAATVRTSPGALHVLLIEDITARKALERDNQVMLTSLRTMLQRFDGAAWGAAQPPQSAAGGAPVSQSGCTIFADLSSFTRMAAEIPPAELFAHLDRRVRVAVDAILRYGGRIDRVMGDGVLAFFPDVGAGHQSAYNALRAARDIVAARGEESRRLPFRVGLDFGEVIVGAVGRREFGMTAVVGEPVVVAQRLAQAARPGEILLTGSVVERATHGVRAQELVGVGIQGIPAERSAFWLEHLDLP